MVVKLATVVDVEEMYHVFHFCLFQVKNAEMAAIWKVKIDLSIFSQTLRFFDGIFFSCDAHQLDKTFAIKIFFIRLRTLAKNRFLETHFIFIFLKVFEKKRRPKKLIGSRLA